MELTMCADTVCGAGQGDWRQVCQVTPFVGVGWYKFYLTWIVCESVKHVNFRM